MFSVLRLGRCWAWSGKVSVPVEEEVSGGMEGESLGESLELLSCFSSLRRRSRPSTRFRSASRTSVFGPRFLGTASGRWSLAVCGHAVSYRASCRLCFRDIVMQLAYAEGYLTIYTGTLEDLAGLTSRPQPVALDLEVGLARGKLVRRCRRRPQLSTIDSPSSCDSSCNSYSRGAHCSVSLRRPRPVDARCPQRV